MQHVLRPAAALLLLALLAGPAECARMLQAKEQHVAVIQGKSSDATAPAKKLPFRSGSIVSIKSPLYESFCTVGGNKEDIQWGLRCNEIDADTGPSKGLLIIGKSFMTADIVDGGSVYIKSQKENKFCSVGPAALGSYITCHEIHYGASSEFVISIAGPDGEVRLRPADDPKAWCHVTKDSRRASEPTHYVRCGGRSSEEAQTFIVDGSGSSYGPPSGGDDSGGGYWPGPSGGDDSGGGYWPGPSGGDDSGGGYWPGPSGGGDWPSGGDDSKGRGKGEGGDDWMPDGDDGQGAGDWHGDIPDEYPSGAPSGGSEQGGGWH